MDQDPIQPVITIGAHTGRFSKGTGPYHLDLSDTISDGIIDGSPHPDHPMTCFGRINEDIYKKMVNVRFSVPKVSLSPPKPSSRVMSYSLNTVTNMQASGTGSLTSQKHLMI